MKYKIVLLRFGSPYNPDGVNNSIYILAEALIELGCRVTVIGGYGVPSCKVTEVFDIDRVPEVYTLIEQCAVNRFRLWRAWVREGYKLLKNLEPDIIIANGIIPVPKIGFRVLRIHDVPEALHQRLIVKALIGSYNCIVFSSSIIRSRFLEKFKYVDSKIFVIPLPIKLERYKSRPLDEREHAVLFVDGRKRRNLHFALMVFNEVARHDSDVKMYVVGVERPSSDDYPKGRVFFLGFINRKELRELYSRVKLLLIPSSYEGFGYPVLEAFASGTPVVGSNAIPSELLINGYNGFRIKEFKVKSYANAIVKLLSDSILWWNFHWRALEKTKECDAKNIALKYLHLAKELG